MDYWMATESWPESFAVLDATEDRLRGEGAISALRTRARGDDVGLGELGDLVRPADSRARRRPAPSNGSTGPLSCGLARAATTPRPSSIWRS
ncbi:MAG: hypothetical protein ACOYEV_19165, partial [Candidatus Nanopelagicales bacterium]